MIAENENQRIFLVGSFRECFMGFLGCTAWWVWVDLIENVDADDSQIRE
jgi:hypothetical protein